MRSHRLQDDSLTLTLRSGWEVICGPRLISSIAPDEAPQLEPTDLESDARADMNDDRSSHGGGRLQPNLAAHGAIAGSCRRQRRR